MTSEQMTGTDVLALEQGIYLHSEEWEMQVVGMVDEISEDFFGVSLDVSDRDFVNAPQQGTELSVAAQGDNCVYRFVTRLRGTSALPEKRWFLDFPEIVERQQKRHFVRVPVPLEMGIQVKLPNGLGTFHSSKEMTLCDISGNGICFASDHEAAVGSRVSLQIDDLPGYGKLSIVAEVRRCTPIRFLNHYVYHIGAHMADDISEKQQDKLVRALFQLQQQYLKKGIGV